MEEKDLTQVDDTTKLNEQLKTCNEQRDEWKDRCLRLSAEFENYKKRNEKERVQWIASAQSTILVDLLAIVDDFDRAFEQLHSKEKSPDIVQWITGFELIYKGLHKMLDKYGVKEIAAQKEFDPIKHEAIMQVESVEHQSGQVVKILQKEEIAQMQA